jgi:hypothetical protein
MDWKSDFEPASEPGLSGQNNIFRGTMATMEKRPLTLAAVPPELIAEFGLQHVTLASYRCHDARSALEPIGRVRIGQPRMLNIDALKRILGWIRSDSPVEAVAVVREANDQLTLLAGMHRYQVSIALGCRTIPCRRVTEDEAAEMGWRPMPSP